MAATRFTELRVWKLASELHAKICDVTRRAAAQQDREFCDQIRAASASVSANIAEGFARYSHRDFARFLAIARGSLAETQNHLQVGLSRNQIARDTFQQLWELSTRTMAATTGLLMYLRTHPDPPARRSGTRRT